MTLLSELEQKARGATQKFYSEHPKMAHFKNYLIGVDGSEEDPFVLMDPNRHMENWKNDLDFIVAASPTNILKLISVMRKMENNLESLAGVTEIVLEENKAEIECRGDEDCDHCHLIGIIHESRSILAEIKETLG